MCEAKRFLSSELLDFSKNTEHFFHSSWRRRRGGSHFEKKIRVVSNLEICKLRWHCHKRMKQDQFENATESNRILVWLGGDFGVIEANENS